MNNILLLGVGTDQIPAIQKSREIGLGVLGLDGNKNAAGAKLCDVFECIDIKNPDLVETKAKEWNKKYNIAGVMAPAVEAGISVGRVVDKLGLLGINEDKGTTLTDKVQRYYNFNAWSILSPKFCNDNPEFPCVIKPRDKCGAKGVKLIENKKQLEHEKWDIAQEYLEGWEVSTEVLVFEDGNFIATNADRNYDKKLKWKPYLIEDGCQLPSKLPPHIKQKIKIVIRKVIDCLKLKSCAIKFDLLIKDNLVYVIECAPRLGGGKLSSIMIPMSYGIDWWTLAIKLAMGMKIEEKEITPRKRLKYVAQRYVFPKKVESHYDRITDFISTGKDYKTAIKNAEDMVYGFK